MSIHMQSLREPAAARSFTPTRAGPLQRCGESPCPTGKCEKRGGRLRRGRYSSALAESTSVDPIVSEALHSPDEPLGHDTRISMESRFGHDFSQVRVHSNAKAAKAARVVSALAYTVGRDIVFGAGKYSPETTVGKRLIAHELAHVIQQGRGHVGVQAYSVVSADHPSEREADRAAQAALEGQIVKLHFKTFPGSLQRAEGDVVRYSGGPNGTLSVVEGGKQVFSTRAVSGHPGSKEFERGVGPIPTGRYLLHPQTTQPKVTKLQAGVCGANPISSGYQEIANNDPSPCTDPTNHYCTVSCPAVGDPGRMCFTPKECWGEKRIKIEGSVKVLKPTSGIVTRSGFYIHGGNHAVAVTSGCIKVFDNATFTFVRKLRGSVPLCVGKACPTPAGAM